MPKIRIDILEGKTEAYKKQGVLGKPASEIDLGFKIDV